MKEVSPKLLKVLRLQFTAAICNSIAAAFCAVMLVNQFFQDINLFLGIVLSLGSTWLIARILNAISIVLIQLYVYGTDTKSMIEDAKKFTESTGTDGIPSIEPEVKRINIKIVSTSEKPIGKFMDTSFFEWVIIDDGVNGPRKFTFSGTTQMQNGSVAGEMVGPGTIVFYPGLIYQVEPK